MKFTYISLYITTLFFVLINNVAKAQVSNCNAFLKGNYLEVGFNWNGAIGTSYIPPVGYHPVMTSSYYQSPVCGGGIYSDSSLGIVSDVNMSGWSSGSYLGDYVLPGDGQEGWSLMIGSEQINGWNILAKSTDTLQYNMLHDFIEYQDSANFKLVKWQGLRRGLYVTQFYRIDKNANVMKVSVLLENSSLETLSDIYFMRTINVNTNGASGSLTTVNKILHQQPNALDKVEVYSRNASPGADNGFVFMASQYPYSKAFISNTSTLPDATTINNIYSGDGAFLYNGGDSNIADASIGLVFYGGTLSSGQGVQMDFVYGFKESMLDSVWVPVSIKDAEFNQLSLYPNPAENILSYSLINQEPHSWQLVDVFGRVAKYGDNTTNKASIDITTLAHGLYTFILTTDNKNSSIRQKFIKQ